MAGNTVDISLKVTQEGLDSVVKSSKTVADFFAEAAASANNLVAASAKVKPVPTGSNGGAARQSADKASSELNGYGKDRALIGTGASARDFAKQAQGLSGLVHLYATFAANIFAATAAFQALSKAMDTANMVKGLDQLGASSGRALGGLAKQVAAASDGMLSMKDSIAAVAQASASGMGSKQILQMTEVAKKASIALGRDMTDSISRITKGVGKLEPELLDELGILTRVDKATQDYARSVGKTTAELSQYEKQQAFANAVIKEGLDKFSAIDIAANPYQKLLATLSDLSTSGLNLINKVLGPIAGYLANSPTALTVVLAGIASMLVKQAIPALGNWKASLKDAAKQAADTADAFTKSFDDNFQKKLFERFKIPDLTAQLEKAKKASKELGSLPSSLSSVKSALALSVSPSDSISDTNINAVKKVLEKRQAYIDTGIKGTKALTDAQKEQYSNEVSYLTKVIELKKAEKSAYQKLDTAGRQAEVAADTNQGMFDVQKIAINKAIALRKQYDSISAISNAANNAQIVGIRRSWALLNDEIANKGITGLTKYTTLAKGGFAAVFSRITGIVGALGNVGAVVGAVIAGFQILDAVFTKSEKESAAFADSIGALQDTARGAKDTLAQVFNPKDLSATKSIRDITAIANAFADTKDSIEKATTSYLALTKAMGTWDKIIDGLKFGYSAKNTLAKSIQAAIEQAIKLANTSGINTGLEDKLKNALGTSSLSGDALVSSLKNLPDDKLKLINDLLEQSNTKIRENEQRFVSLNAAIDSASKQMQEFQNSLIPGDIVTKLGMSVLSIGSKLGDLISAPADQAVAELAKISTDATQLIGLDPQDAKRLIEYSGALNGMTESRKRLIVESKKVDEDLAASKKTLDSLLSQPTLDYSNLEESTKAQEAVKNLENTRTRINADLVRNVEAIAQANANFADLATGALARGADIIKNSIGIAMDKAKLAFAKSEFQGPAGLGDAKRAADLAIAEINIQERQIETQLTLAKALAELTDATNRRSAQEDLAKNANDKNGDKYKAAQTTLDILDKKDALKNLNSSQLAKTIGLYKGVDINTQKAANSQLGDQSKLESLQAQELTLQAQKRGEALKAQQATIAELLALEQRLTDLAVQRSALQYAYVTALSNITSIVTEYTAQSQAQADYEALRNKQLKERQAIEAQISQLSLSRDPTKQQQILEKQSELRKVQYNQALELSNLEVQSEAKISAAKITRLQQDIDLSSKLRDINTSYANASIDLEQNLLNYRVQSGTASETYIATQTASLALQKQELEYASKKADIEDRAAKDKLASDSILTSLNAKFNDNPSKAVYDQIEAEKALAKVKQASTDSEIAALETANTVRKNQIKLTEQAAKEQADYNKTIEQLSSFTDSLSSTFGDMGKRIGDSFKKGFEVYTKYQKNQQKINTEFAGNDKKLKSESLKNTLGMYAEEAGAARELFGEKTFLGKTFAAVEKGLHIARMVMMGVELAEKISTNIAGMASDAEAAGVSGVRAVISAMANLDTPLNFAAGAAMAAAVATLIASIGGSGPSAPQAGFSAEDRQKTQGTATTYKDGKVVDNGQVGVLGDTSAKSESIAKSIEILKDNSIDGLQYNSKMLDALLGIKNAIAGASTTLYTTLGIAKGSAFGTQDVSISKSGISGLFGKSTTKEIVDSGIKIQGTFTDLANGLAGTVKQYETIQQTVKKSGFLGIGGSTSVSYIDNIKEADSSITSAIKDIFTHATDVFISVGSKLGETAADVLSKLGTINVDQLTSLKGLTGDDLEKQFSSVISSILDSATNSLFSEMKKYQAFGEGLLETVVRVVDSNDNIKLSFDSIGKSYSTIGFDVSEALVKTAGSLSNFLDQVSFFKDNFLSDLEKLTPVQLDVNKTLASLGYSTIQTREQFKALIQSLDLTNPAAQETYAALMKLAPAFVEVTAKMQELITSNTDLESQILEAVGTEKARAELLARTTAGMNAATLAEYERNQQLTKQLDTVNQYNDLAKQLIEVQDGLLSDTDALLAQRKRERDTLAEINKPLYDLINAYKDLKSANDTMASSLVSMQSIVSGLASAADSAASRLKSAESALSSGYKAAQDKADSTAKAALAAASSIASAFIALQEKADTAAKAVDSAAANIANSYIAAQEKVTSTAQAVKDAASSIASAFVALQEKADTAAKAVDSAAANIANSFIAAQEKIISTAQAVRDAAASIVNSYKSAQDRSASAAKATSSAASSIAKGYLSAKTAVATASKQLADAQASASKAIKDSLRSLATSIRDFINTTSTSELGINTPKQNLSALTSQFTELLAAAKNGDQGAMSKLTDIGSTLLSTAKEQASSSLEYAKTYGFVIGSLDDISKAAAAIAGPAQDDTQSQILDSINALNDAQADLIKWQEAINSTGIDANKYAEDTSTNIADLLDVYNTALKDQSTADAETASWQKAVNDANIDIAKYTENTSKTISDLLDTYNKALKDQDTANADLVAWQHLVSTTGIDIAKYSDTTSKNISNLLDAYNLAIADQAQISADLITWQKAIYAANIDVSKYTENTSKTITDLLTAYNKALKDQDTASTDLAAWQNLVSTTGIDIAKYSDSTSKNIDNLLTAYNAAVAEQAQASADLIIWQKALYAANIDVSKYTESTSKTLQDLLDAYSTAITNQLNADSDLSLWQAKLVAANIDISKFTENTSTSIDKLITEYTSAFTANSKAQADLLEAQRLTAGYNLTTISTLQTLTNTIKAYEEAKAIAEQAKIIIDNTNTQSIVSAINNLGDIIKATPPTVKIPEAGAIDQVSAKTASAGTNAIVTNVAPPTNTYMGQEVGSSGGIISDNFKYPIAQYAEGTNYVPHDGLAYIHEGEKITPAKFNGDIDQQLLEEISLLRAEVAKLTLASTLTEQNTRKSKDILVRVTEDGTAMKTM